MTPTTYRSMVFKRDGGVCSLCYTRAADLERFLAVNYWGRTRRPAPDYSFSKTSPFDGWFKLCQSLGWHPKKSFWEADHILPRYLGGTDERTNLRTLCYKCHRTVTAKQAAARAAR